jgi:hypothetical protein
MTVSIVPTSDALGAEVAGVDLRQPLDPATVKTINDAFDRHVVLVFRGQELSEAEQLRAAGYFGTVHVRQRPANNRTPGGDYDTPFMLVTNIVENGKPIGAFGDGEMWFHHDTSYYPEPHRATLLYSMQLPSRGGNTCFSNMYKAYENIPRGLRDRLEGRNVLQIHDYKRRERIDLGKVDLASIRHHHPSGDRPQSALHQPPDVGADRRAAARRERSGAQHAVRYFRGSRDRLRARMAAGRPGDLGQLVLDSRPQGFSARSAAIDAAPDDRRPGHALLKAFLKAACEGRHQSSASSAAKRSTSRSLASAISPAMNAVRSSNAAAISACEMPSAIAAFRQRVASA